jgi:hypothetical protein
VSALKEFFYAIRRTDGEDIGDYAWLRADGPDDWSSADDDYGEPTEYEIVCMVVMPVARRVLPEVAEDE